MTVHFYCNRNTNHCWNVVAFFPCAGCSLFFFLWVFLLFSCSLFILNNTVFVSRAVNFMAFSLFRNFAYFFFFLLSLSLLLPALRTLYPLAIQIVFVILSSIRRYAVKMETRTFQDVMLVAKIAKRTMEAL